MKMVQHIMSTRLRSASLLVFLSVLCLKAEAQFDPMFSQYMNNEMFINPAYTGTRKVLSATLLYRDQWVGLTGAPKTQTFSVHAPVGKKNGLGLSMLNESIGITSLSRVNVNYSYRIKTGELSSLSFGLMGGIIQYRQDMNKLLLVNPVDHHFVENTPNLFAPNAGFGMFYYTNKFYVGLSIPRMIKNSIKNSRVENSATPDNWHYYLTSAYVFDLDRNFKLKTSGMVKHVNGAPVQAELALHGLINNFLWLGASYRTGDAVTAITGLQISKQLRIFYSFDYSLTSLQQYSSGSHEIIISYDLANRKYRITSPRIF